MGRRGVKHDLAPDRIEIGPEAPFATAAGLLQDRHGRIVRLQIRGGAHLATELVPNRPEGGGDVRDPAAQGRARQIHALAQEDAFEAVERQVVDILRDHHVREEPFPRQRFFKRLGRRRGLHDAFMTVRARIFEARGLDHAQTRRDKLEFLGHGLTDARLPVAACTDLVCLRDVDLDALPWQGLRKRPPARISTGPDASSAGHAKVPCSSRL